MARKLKLALEDLAVESFHVTRSPGGERGTVFGNSGLTEPGSDSYGEQTCGWTCGLDCDRTFELCWTQLDCPTPGYTQDFGCVWTQDGCFTHGGGGGFGGGYDMDHDNMEIGGC